MYILPIDELTLAFLAQWQCLFGFCIKWGINPVAKVKTPYFNLRAKRKKKKRLVTVILNILRTRWFHFNQLQIMDVMTDFNSDNLRWLSNVRFCSVIERNLKLYALLYFSFLFIFSFHSFWQFTALKQPFEIWVRQKWLVIPHISSSLNKCQSKSKKAYCSRAIRTN